MSQTLIKSFYYADSNVTLPHERHRHNVYEMLLIFKGAVSGEIAGKHISCTAPACIFIGNQEPHLISAAADRPYTRYVLTLDPVLADRLLRPTQLSSVFSFHPSDFSHALDITPIAQEIEWMLHAIERERELPFEERGTEGEALLLSALLYRLRQFSPSHFSSRRSGAAELTVSSVRSELESNFAQKLNLEALAKRHHISRYYLAHIFKQVTGYGLKEYRMHCRISHAARCLEEGEMPIHTIAEESGFHDMSNFSRAFKEMFGISPSKFRQRARQSSPAQAAPCVNPSDT